MDIGLDQRLALPAVTRSLGNRMAFDLDQLDRPRLSWREQAEQAVEADPRADRLFLAVGRDVGRQFDLGSAAKRVPRPSTSSTGNRCSAPVASTAASSGGRGTLLYSSAKRKWVESLIVSHEPSTTFARPERQNTPASASRVNSKATPSNAGPDTTATARSQAVARPRTA